MIVGRILYILGLIFAVYSIAVLVMSFFTGGGNIIMIFGVLNGFIAMGVGDLVINMYKRKQPAVSGKLDNKEQDQYEND
ncbi:hypothetical protein ERJ70_10935 [Sediminibacillus dalangtanensis]|uniref:Uncharacterized protein n=1 Tax=Sediminibacillus dalangtanensis TaxID=2729421 RepID=A0ABX7VS52_9BACI|nr:hypothetical protein [Sediminibacillus dalangtanensis]QTM99767.1 hypothetical protein ERJ70_10935 [Sediminibacillus dalangtanensis]